MGTIIAQRQHVARGPVRVRALSAFKAGKGLKPDAQTVAEVAGLLADADPTVRTGALASLEGLKAGPAQDALCELAIQIPSGPAAQVCIRTGKRPSDPEQECLFLVVTGQIEEYFKADHDFQNLRLAYERAEAKVQARVLAAQGGDRRFVEFIVRPRKSLTECSAEEITRALESCIRHEDWEKLFRACMQVPLKYSFAAWQRLAETEWRPQLPELASMHAAICREVKGQAVPATQAPSAESSLFDRWLNQGRGEERTRLGEAELLNRLGSTEPPEGVAIVAALAAQGHRGPAVAQAISQSPHWLVRLAGDACGLITNLSRDNTADDNYWVRELAGSAGVLEFWPGKATPADVDELSQAPAEALAGRLGTARRVLQLILCQLVEGIVVQPVEFEADETAAVIRAAKN